MTCDVEQRSPEWDALHVGKVTASRLADMTATIKKGEAADRRKYREELVAETLTGIPCDSRFNTKEMLWGIANEKFARAAYEMHIGALVQSCGFAIHEKITRFGASPDGLVGDDGLVELKCPNTTTHLGYILAGVVPEEYQPQMLAQMACTGRAWCDFVSFDPRLPAHLQLFVVRFYRDEERIAEIEQKVMIFLAEVDAVLAKLNGTNPPAAPTVPAIPDAREALLGEIERDLQFCFQSTPFREQTFEYLTAERTWQAVQDEQTDDLARHALIVSAMRKRIENGEIPNSAIELQTLLDLSTDDVWGGPCHEMTLMTAMLLRSMEAVKIRGKPRGPQLVVTLMDKWKDLPWN